MTQQILVVEDDPSIANLIAFGLEHQFSITKVHDIEEALELISAKKFDLILLDWMLPGLSGIELIRKMRRKSPRKLMMARKKTRTHTWC